MTDVSDLIGIPYKENGRTKEGLDCYGLAILVEKRFGKALQDVVYENHDFKLSAKYTPLLNIKKTDCIKAGTLLEFRIKDTLHIGVALDERNMIHATVNQGVRISRIAAYKLSAIYEVL